MTNKETYLQGNEIMLKYKVGKEKNLPTNLLRRKNMQKAKNLERVERERERESRSLKAIAVLACKKGEISLQTGKLYIIYRELKVDMQLIHRQTVF